MNKNTIKALKAIAIELPELRQGKGFLYQRVSGTTLLTQGVEKLGDGSQVKPDKDYVTSKDQGIPVNHMKKLKRAWASGGFPEVQKYVEAVKKQDMLNRTAEV